MSVAVRCARNVALCGAFAPNEGSRIQLFFAFDCLDLLLSILFIYFQPHICHIWVIRERNGALCGSIFHVSLRFADALMNYRHIDMGVYLSVGCMRVFRRLFGAFSVLSHRFYSPVVYSMRYCLANHSAGQQKTLQFSSFGCARNIVNPSQPKHIWS